MQLHVALPCNRSEPHYSLARPARLDQTDGGTRVTFQGNPNPVGVFKLLSPLFGHVGQKVWSRRLARAKAALVSPASSNPKTLT
jgi:hypothetical protein